MAKLQMKAIQGSKEEDDLFTDDFNAIGNDDDGGVKFEGACTIGGPVLGEGYFSIDDGVITDEDEILMAKRRQQQDVLKELLVGSYNDKNGQYRVSEKIEIELHNVKKIVSKRVGDCYFVTSVTDLCGYGNLEFMVQTNMLISGERRAQLFLTEEIERDAGSTLNTNVFLVSEFKDIADALFIPKMYATFNILDPAKDQDEIEKHKHEIAEHTLKRKMFLKHMGDNIGPDVELLESQLLEARIEMLQKEGKIGAEIMAEFEKKKKKRTKKNKGQNDLDARALNEMLEEALKDAKTKADKNAIKDIFDKQRKDVIDNLKQMEQLKKDNMTESIKQANADYRKELNKPMHQREMERDFRDQRRDRFNDQTKNPSRLDPNTPDGKEKTGTASQYDPRMYDKNGGFLGRDRNNNGIPDWLEGGRGGKDRGGDHRHYHKPGDYTPAPGQDSQGASLPTGIGGSGIETGKGGPGGDGGVIQPWEGGSGGDGVGTGGNNGLENVPPKTDSGSKQGGELNNLQKQYDYFKNRVEGGLNPTERTVNIKNNPRVSENLIKSEIDVQVRGKIMETSGENLYDLFTKATGNLGDAITRHLASSQEYYV